MSRFPVPLFAAIFIVLFTRYTAAHEYWIVPTDYTVDHGGTVALRLMVGQMMTGSELPWLPNQIASFRVATSEGEWDVTGIAGDLPAAKFDATVPGLVTVAHSTLPLPITFANMSEFREYLEYEGLSAISDLHVARGLPYSGFTEHYARNARALLQVGPIRPEDTDISTGLPFELLALRNPYAGGETLPVRLSWRGMPEGGAQIAIFMENASGVVRTVVKTNSDGQADIPLVSGARYLLSAVHMEPVDGQVHVWESTWASLTFATLPVD